MNSRFYPYATDSNERDTLAYCFAVAAVALAFGINAAATAANAQLPWWISFPTPMALYLMIRGVFATYVWRWPPLRKLRIIKILDLNGTYKGHLWTSHEGGEKHPCTLIITQTWTRISIRGYFPRSTSFNMVTGISVEDTSVPRLTYEYWNMPNADAVESMQAHRGTIWFDIISGGDSLALKGDYYTGRGRETVGRVEVIRQQ